MAPIGSPRSFSRRDLLKGFAAAGIGATSGAVAHGYLYERFRVGLTRETLEVSGLPPAFSGLRVGLITDLHRSDTVSHEMIDHAVQILMAETPDLVILGGDYVTWGDRRFVGAGSRCTVAIVGTARRLRDTGQPRQRSRHAAGSCGETLRGAA